MPRHDLVVKQHRPWRQRLLIGGLAVMAVLAILAIDGPQQRSALAALPPQHVDTILMALDLGLSALGLLDAERFPPELHGVALRLLAGMKVDQDQVPPVAE
jgi:hypothetical protein